MGGDEGKIELVGSAVDAVKLINKLERKVGFAKLESVAEVKEEKDEKKKKEEEEKKKLEEAAETFQKLLPPPPPLLPPVQPYSICYSY